MVSYTPWLKLAIRCNGGYEVILARGLSEGAIEAIIFNRDSSGPMYCTVTGQVIASRVDDRDAEIVRLNHDSAVFFLATPDDTHNRPFYQQLHWVSPENIAGGTSEVPGSRRCTEAHHPQLNIIGRYRTLGIVMGVPSAVAACRSKVSISNVQSLQRSNWLKM